MKKLFLKTFLLVIMIGIPYIGFMYFSDPYCLFKNDLRGKTLPNFHMYSYNLLKRFEKIDHGFLGSSVVNYYDMNYFFPNSVNYSMGIESSTVEEQIAFGKVLAAKKPKEIVFFLSFYSFNPSRNPEKYFNKYVVSSNNICVDFLFQYANYPAFKDALNYWQVGKQDSTSPIQFYSNGSRTQKHYLNDTAYSFKKSVTNYLTLNFADVRLYGSKSFKEESSVDKAIDKLKEYRDYLKEKGIELKLAFAPDHRLTTSMIYYMGLGNTFEALRKKILQVQPFYELNADTSFTSDSLNYWDAHHVRKSEQLMNDLSSDKFLVTSKNIDSIISLVRPRQKEIDKVIQIFRDFQGWKDVCLQAEKDRLLNPPQVP